MSVLCTFGGAHESDDWGLLDAVELSYLPT